MQELTKQRIYEISTIVNRFDTIHITASEAAKAILDVRFNLVDELISIEEKTLLFEAQILLNSIKDRTSIRQAQEYISNKFNLK